MFVLIVTLVALIAGFVVFLYVPLHNVPQFSLLGKELDYSSKRSSLVATVTYYSREVPIIIIIIIIIITTITLN